MKQFRMTDRKGPPDKKMSQKSSPSDSAFDKWLNRGLHELFDDVMKEPVPPELLKLLKSEPKPGAEKKKKNEDDSKK